MVFEKIREIVAEQFGVSPSSLSRDTDFVGSLGADSLDIIELTMTIEEAYSLKETDEDELKSIFTLGDLVEYVEKELEGK